MLQPEVFDRFEQTLSSGDRTWWDETSPEWIDRVSATGRPFYTRLVPGGLDQVPGLSERLIAGVRIADTACGAGLGVIRLAEQYPASTSSASTATCIRFKRRAGQSRNAASRTARSSSTASWRRWRSTSR